MSKPARPDLLPLSSPALWLAARSAAFFQRTRDDNWRDLELIAMIAYMLRIPQRQRAASVQAVLDRWMKELIATSYSQRSDRSDLTKPL
jgi:hypothetical protein